MKETFLFMIPSFESHLPKSVREIVKDVLPSVEASLEDLG